MPLALKIYRGEIMEKRRLLISYAHPDDESFGNGGLIAKYVAEGVDVYLICATDGDLGTIPDEMKGQYETVRELRLAELDCANDVLGFKEIFKLGYKDSGMMGSESINDPACLWYQWQNKPEAVTKRVVELIRDIKPHVVITFNKYGGYGHPDHIAIQAATTQAISLAADKNYLSDGQMPYQVQKLYYSSIPAFFVRFFLFTMRLQGKDVRRMGTNQDIDFVKIVENIEPTHTVVSIGDYLAKWDESSACHKSQGGGRAWFGSFPMWIRRILQGKQGFTRVYPAPRNKKFDEQDLFQNVRLEERQMEHV
jgi:LmbE family N-acetylglucosaminyl deacetylase